MSSKMDLILWRHAEAFELHDGGDDLDRALTPKGERQAARVADWLSRQLTAGTGTAQLHENQAANRDNKNTRTTGIRCRNRRNGHHHNRQHFRWQIKWPEYIEYFLGQFGTLQQHTDPHIQAHVQEQLR